MTLARRRWLGALVFIISAATAATRAHIGSPDVFVAADAGPYPLFITVRPARVVPGEATVEILTTADDVRSVRVVPTPMSGPGATFAPAPVEAHAPSDNPRLYTTSVWMMSAGAWEVRVSVAGARGEATVAVPVPTLPQATLAMGRGLGGLLWILMAVLAIGFISIASALAREATLETGGIPDPLRRRRGRRVGALTALGVVAILVFGRWWWNAEALAYSRYVYKPLQALVHTDEGRLSLSLRDPGWLALRRVDDLVADHGHLMHLFVVSPTLDRLWHLHPNQTPDGAFLQNLPAAPAGSYEVFADVVHASGLSETVTAALDLPTMPGTAALGEDDVAWSGSAKRTPGRVSTLSDGTRMLWRDPDRPLRAGPLQLFTFDVQDAAGAPVTDLELYMGMPAHAVFIRRDRQVFAHVHPSGSAPMAALELSRQTITPGPSATMDMAEHVHGGAALPATVTFPYGLPSAGDYRIFVQVKRRGRIETGVFDAHVD